MKKYLLFLFVLSCLFSYGQSGITWSSAITVASSGYDNMHPRVALNANGDPMVLWGNSSNKVYFARWNGAAFSTPVALNPASMPCFTASWAGPDFASKGDTVYAVFKETPEDSLHHIYAVHSFN